MNGRKIHTCIAENASAALRMAKEKFGADVFILSQGTLHEVDAALPGEAIESFRGSDLNEAIRNAYAVLGADAEIITNRELVELCVELDVEPVAVLPEPTAEATAARVNALFSKAYGSSPLSAKVSAEYVAPRQEREQPRKQTMAASGSDDMLGYINRKLEEICRYARTPERPQVAESLIELYHKMLDNDVCEDIARHLVEKLNGELDMSRINDASLVREAMLGAISKLIPVDGPVKLREDGQATVVVIVGPTGVGKTTSIAKLAMQFRMQNKSVALITEDTSRPAAREQLQSVSQFMSIPVAVADTVDRVSSSLRKFADKDVILVDTAGRVPRNKESIENLSAFLNEIKPDEVHLALCSLSGQSHILDTIKRFGEVRFDKIILTKLDEATTYGLILNIAAHVDKGVSYITTGQEYIENIEPGESKRLAGLVLGEGMQG